MHKIREMLFWNTIKSYYKNNVYEYWDRKIYLEKYKIGQNIYHGVNDTCNPNMNTTKKSIMQLYCISAFQTAFQTPLSVYYIHWSQWQQ